MKAKNLLVCATLMFTVGCGDWLQDPLSGKDDKFRRGGDKPTEADKGTPMKSDAVSIVAPDMVMFEEDSENNFAIISRVFIPDYDLKVEIEGLEDLPGATFDAKEKRLSWTPPLGFVEEKVQGEDEFQIPIRIVALATKPDEQVYTNDKEVLLRVRRSFSTPEIVQVNPANTFVREGSAMNISVIVKDRDARPDDQATYPTLVMQPVGADKSLSGLTRIVKVESVGNQRYAFTLKVDVSGGEFSSSIDAYRMSLVAYSRHGKGGTEIPVELNIYTLLATPATTWTETLKGTVGKTLTHKFLISDPKQEGKVELEATKSLPDGAQIDCQPQAIGILGCTLTWKPKKGQEGAQTISMDILSRNRDIRDTFVKKTTLDFLAQIAPKGQ